MKRLLILLFFIISVGLQTTINSAPEPSKEILTYLEWPHNLKNDKCFFNEIMDYLKRKNLKEATYDEPSISFEKNYAGVALKIFQAIKNHKELLQSFLSDLHLIEIEDGHDCEEFFSFLLNKLLDDPEIREKIVKTAKQKKKTMGKSIIRIIEKHDKAGPLFKDKQKKYPDYFIKFLYDKMPEELKIQVAAIQKNNKK